MAQINARVPDDVAARLDRWASATGIDRSVLVRDILAEAVTAHAEGRASFERPEMPGPAELLRLAARLDQQSTELDRVLRQNAKRDAELMRQARADTVGVSQARDTIVADVVAAMRGALETVHGELVRSREELLSLMERLPQIAAVDAKLDQMLTAVREPRVVKNYNIGLGNWSGGMLAMAGLLVIIAGMFGFSFLAEVLPERWLELRYANRLLGGGDRAICRLVDYQYGTGLTGCRTTIAGRTVTVTATAPQPARASR